MNVDVLDVNSGGESFKRVVVEPVQRGQQPEVFGNPLCQRLAERVILNGQRHVVAQHFKSVERLFFIQGFAGPASQGDYSGQLSPNFQRANALEQFGRDNAVRTQKDIVGGTVEQHRAGGRGQGVHVAGKQGNQGRFRQQRESLRIDRGQQGRPFAERKQRSLTRAGRFHHGGQHGAGGLAEVAVRRKFGPQIRQRFDCS